VVVKGFTNRAEEEALLLYKSYASPMGLPPSSALENPAKIVEEEMTPKAPDDEFLVLPPTKPKASLKPSKFFPVFAEQTPPRLADAHMKRTRMMIVNLACIQNWTKGWVMVRITLPRPL
jgi:hypothetical protein